MSPLLFITGGGTGGHVSPGLAVAQAWGKRYGRQSLAWVGQAGAIEERMVKAEGLTFHAVDSAKLRRSFSLSNLALPLRVGRGFLQARKLLKQRKPNVVLMVGGFAGLPLSLAAGLMKVPLVTLDLDASRGLANQIAARFAWPRCHAWPHGALPLGEQLTGNPVRFAKLPARASARKHLGLPARGPVLLVMPGSGAAHSINLALAAALPRLKKACPHLALFWMCGSKDLGACQAALKASGLAGKAVAFIERVDQAYAASNALLTRAGSSMLAELASVGLPSLLVPYPYAARDHQRHNAEAFAKAGAAAVLLDHQLEPSVLAGALVKLLKGGPAVKRMGQAAKKLSRPDAAQKLLQALQSAMGAKRV